MGKCSNISFLSLEYVLWTKYQKAKCVVKYFIPYVICLDGEYKAVSYSVSVWSSMFAILIHVHRRTKQTIRGLVSENPLSAANTHVNISIWFCFFFGNSIISCESV